MLRYDNLSSAVKKILRGQQRELTSRFIAFRSHWQYRAEFCTPGEGHEKGGIEGEAGYFRRNHWVPVPTAADLASLHRKLLADYRSDERLDDLGPDRVCRDTAADEAASSAASCRRTLRPGQG